MLISHFNKKIVERCVRLKERYAIALYVFLRLTPPCAIHTKIPALYILQRHAGPALCMARRYALRALHRYASYCAIRTQANSVTLLPPSRSRQQTHASFLDAPTHTVGTISPLISPVGATLTTTLYPCAMHHMSIPIGH